MPAGKIRLPDARISLFPTPVVIVTAANYAGQVGATTIAWTGVLSSRPPVLGVSFLPDSFTRSCIAETREFTINIPDGAALGLVRVCGALTGPVGDLGDSSSTVPGMTLLDADTVRAPLIAECFLNFECRLLSTVQLGLYDCFLGQVLTAHCDEEVYRDDHPRGNVYHPDAQPAICLGDQYWSAGQFLGVSAENKDHPHGPQH